jgi:hypothetical protein
MRKSDLRDVIDAFSEASDDYNKHLQDLVDKCDYETKLAVTAWVFRNIVDHAKEGGSYRYLIYDRLGFEPDAYVPLFEAGGMEISNEFDFERIDDIIDIVKEHKLDVLKSVLNMCDEPGCFDHAGCGFPTENGYRRTCYAHSDFNKDKENKE